MTMHIIPWIMTHYPRDEDDEMKKFIETEMGKIKGKDLEAEQESEGIKYLSPEDAALQVFFISDPIFLFVCLYQ